MFQKNVVEKIKTNILRSITFSKKSCRSWDNVEKNCRTWHAMEDGASHAGYIRLEIHTQKI